MAVSYLLQAVGMVQGFILIPFYIHFIGAELYGYWLASGGILIMLSVMDLGLNQPVAQKVAFAHSQGNANQASRWFISGLILNSALLAVAFIPADLVARKIPAFLSLPQAYRQDFEIAIFLAYAATLLKILNDFLRAYASAILRPFVPSTGLVISQITGIVITILALFDGHGLLSIPAGLLASQFLSLAVSLTFLAWLRIKGILALSFDVLGEVKEILKLVPHVMFVKFGWRVTQQVEPTIITLFVGAEATTLYSVSKKIGDLIDRTVNVIWGSAFLPFANLAGNASTEKIDRMGRLIMFILLSLTIIMCAGYIMVNEAFVTIWLSGDLAAPLLLVSLLAGARISEVALNFLSELHVALGRIKFSAKILTFTLGCRLLALVAFVWALGLVGAPLAVISTALVSGEYFYYRARKDCGILKTPVSASLKYIAYALMLITFALLYASQTVLPLSEIPLIGIAGVISLTICLAWFWRCKDELKSQWQS